MANGKPDLGQVVDAVVLAAGRGEHDGVGAARFHHAAQALLLVVARRAHHHHQVESVFGELRLQAGEERNEERLAILLVARMRLQHECDRLGGAAAKVAARLVG